MSFNPLWFLLVRFVFPVKPIASPWLRLYS